MDYQVDGLKELIADLDKSASRSLDEVRAVVQKGALNIKKSWQRSWSGHPHIRHLPRAITYDTRVLVGAALADIGPIKARTQGPLASIAEYGSVNNAPIPGGAPALRAEEPRFIAALAALAERLAEGR